MVRDAPLTDVPSIDLNSRVHIQLLGSFRLLKAGRPVATREGGKTEGFLAALALHPGKLIPRDVLLDNLWPESDSLLAGQSLNTLVYSLHKRLGDALGGATPVLHAQGSYRLNLEAGVGVDVWYLERLSAAGERASSSAQRLVRRLEEEVPALEALVSRESPEGARPTALSRMRTMATASATPCAYSVANRRARTRIAWPCGVTYAAENAPRRCGNTNCASTYSGASSTRVLRPPPSRCSTVSGPTRAPSDADLSQRSAAAIAKAQPRRGPAISRTSRMAQPPMLSPRRASTCCEGPSARARQTGNS